jgi:hypothetical protein
MGYYYGRKLEMDQKNKDFTFGKEIFQFAFMRGGGGGGRRTNEVATCLSSANSLNVELGLGKVR